MREEAAAVAQHCGSDLAVTSLVDKGSAAAQRTAIATAGQLVVATPGRIAQVGVCHVSPHACSLAAQRMAACYGPCGCLAWQLHAGCRRRQMAAVRGGPPGHLTASGLFA